MGFDPETGESRSLTDGELSRVVGYFTVISEPGSGEKAVDAIRHGMEPCGYDISVETHDMASGKDALLADAPQRDAPAKDTQNIGYDSKEGRLRVETVYSRHLLGNRRAVREHEGSHGAIWSKLG